MYFIIDIQYYATLFSDLRLFFYSISANKTRHPIDGMVKPANSARAPAEGDIRMMRGRRLSTLHAPLAVSLSEGTCSSAIFSGQGQEQVQGQGRKGFYLMQISKAVQSPTNCLLKRDLPCYFWRKSNQNVGVGVRESLAEIVRICRTSDFAKNCKLVRPYRHSHTPISVHFWSRVD